MDEGRSPDNDQKQESVTETEHNETKKDCTKTKICTKKSKVESDKPKTDTLSDEEFDKKIKKTITVSEPGEAEVISYADLWARTTPKYVAGIIREFIRHFSFWAQAF